MHALLGRIGRRYGGATFCRCLSHRHRTLSGDDGRELREHVPDCVLCVIRQSVNQAAYLSPSSHVDASYASQLHIVPIQLSLCSICSGQTQAQRTAPSIGKVRQGNGAGAHMPIYASGWEPSGFLRPLLEEEVRELEALSESVDEHWAEHVRQLAADRTATEDALPVSPLRGLARGWLVELEEATQAFLNASRKPPPTTSIELKPTPFNSALPVFHVAA